MCVLFVGEKTSGTARRVLPVGDSEWVFEEVWRTVTSPLLSWKGGRRSTGSRVRVCLFSRLLTILTYCSCLPTPDTYGGRTRQWGPDHNHRLFPPRPTVTVCFTTHVPLSGLDAGCQEGEEGRCGQEDEEKETSHFGLRFAIVSDLFRRFIFSRFQLLSEGAIFPPR